VAKRRPRQRPALHTTCAPHPAALRPRSALVGGLAEVVLHALEVLALNGRTPDLTIVLDMDPEAAFRRVLEREMEPVLADTGDRFEKEDLDWHRRLREAFLAIARKNAERCVVIPAGQTEDALQQEIWDVLARRFPELNVEQTA